MKSSTKDKIYTIITIRVDFVNLFVLEVLSEISWLLFKKAVIILIIGIFKFITVIIYGPTVAVVSAITSSFTEIKNIKIIVGDGTQTLLCFRLGSIFKGKSL